MEQNVIKKKLEFVMGVLMILILYSYSAYAREAGTEKVNAQRKSETVILIDP